MPASTDLRSGRLAKSVGTGDNDAPYASLDGLQTVFNLGQHPSTHRAVGCQPCEVLTRDAGDNAGLIGRIGKDASVLETINQRHVEPHGQRLGGLAGNGVGVGIEQ